MSKSAGVALILGIAMLAAAGWVWERAQPAPNVGAAEVRRLAAAGPGVPSAGLPGSGLPGSGLPGAGSAAGGSSGAGSSAGAPPAVVPTQVATLPAAVGTVRPVRVRIDRLHIAAVVVPTGVDATGAFAVPASVDTVGWYRFGPGLDAPAGSTVIAGHVDSATQGTGAFAQLRRLTQGDRVVVTGSDGRDQTFIVVGREEYPKSTIDLDRYFATTGAPRLTLITCGGPFNRSTGHYRDNVVVTAVPGPTSKGSS